MRKTVSLREPGKIEQCEGAMADGLLCFIRTRPRWAALVHRNRCRRHLSLLAPAWMNSSRLNNRAPRESGSSYVSGFDGLGMLSAHIAGAMLWFIQNRLRGSYCFLISARWS